MNEISDLYSLYLRPGFLLRRAHQISASVFEDECRHLALTPAQFGVMTVLHFHPGLDQSSLARALGFDKVTMLRILRVLEARGLVLREPSPISRRNLYITLTPQGSQWLALAQDAAERSYTRLLEPLDGDTQKDLFLALLRRVVEGLEDQARAPLVPPLESARA